MMKIVNTHKHKAKQNARSFSLGGLAYYSKFVRDFIYHERFLGHMSKLANKPICANSMGMHHTAHLNIGKVNPGKEVDKWHFDSTDYVLVIILSDMEGMVGGELEVLKMELGGKEVTDALERDGGPPQEKVEKISY